MARYRLRTWLRGRLPGPVGRLFPKGGRDCGDHEWYRASEHVDRCYHCRVGERPQEPIPVEGELRVQLDELGARSQSRAG